MVKLSQKSYLAADGSILLESWLATIQANIKPNELNLIRRACDLAQLSVSALKNQPIDILQQGIAIAELLLRLQLDAKAITAGIICGSVQYAELSLDEVAEHLGRDVAQLVRGVLQMDAMRSLHNRGRHNHSQIESLRKMLLAMVDDVRVVLIKLAERACLMHYAKQLDKNSQQQLAQETLDIYAPLANRLGIAEIKWELEDLALRYLNPEVYKEIARALKMRRLEREQYIQQVIAILQEELQRSGIKELEIAGRAKHIYSIYRKMQRKNAQYETIYDVSAVRVLVPTIEDCYSVLSVVHSLWQPIAAEFDDYIATPKSNGYRSLHTAVKGPENFNLEVQIRTFEMHQVSELGVAAHWRYKEGGQQISSYETKIAWLRQVLDWQKEITHEGFQAAELQQGILDDRVYVFTPDGDIMDLIQGATPLDFAYLVHSDIGHRCRGAKINGAIVPLTYQLQMGDRVEILTTREAAPSRDWLNPHLGYLKTSRARAKVHHWFKQRDYAQHAVEGKAIFERELKRLEFHHVDDEQLAQKLHFPSANDMFVALGAGVLRPNQLLTPLQNLLAPKTETIVEKPIVNEARSSATQQTSDIYIAGIDNLMTHTAKCCKPIPGEPIVGFITQGFGISIHRRDCHHILEANENQRARVIDVAWGDKPNDVYPVDLLVEAYDRPGLIRDVTLLMANEKVNLTALTTTVDKKQYLVHFAITIEINRLDLLSSILDKLLQIPNVISAKRNLSLG